MRIEQKGFTLIEIAIVLIVVSILLGYTVALFPKQQELKQYRAVEQEMDQVIAAIVGFAQVNGRLPCPAIPTSGGIEDGGGTIDCNNYGGFVPV
ncbi:MAG: type II secretion system GspH family protein, partial [Gammaproteobacteria bacterium]|nr:type II secretion system GspH family protein [Gammaproteobacteria bacterium]